MKRLQSSLIGAALLAAVLAGTVTAEDTANAKPKRMFARGGYVSGGAFYGDVGRLNDAIGARNFEGLDDLAFTLGFGTFTARWRVISGLEFRGIGWRAATRDNRVTELYGMNGIYNIGFNVLRPHARFRLYPYVGVGLAGYVLRLREKEIAFDTALARPVGDAVLWQKGAALQAGLAFDFLLPTKRNPVRSRVIGLRAGYMFDPSPGRDWEINEVNVSGGPSFSGSGIYAQLVFGHSVKKPLSKWLCGGGCKKKSHMKEAM